MRGNRYIQLPRFLTVGNVSLKRAMVLEKLPWIIAIVSRKSWREPLAG